MSALVVLALFGQHADHFLGGIDQGQCGLCLKRLFHIGEMSAAENHGLHAAILEPCGKIMQTVLLYQRFRRGRRFDGQNQRQERDAEKLQRRIFPIQGLLDAGQARRVGGDDAQPVISLRQLV